LHRYYNNRAELQTAHALGKEMLALAQQVRDPSTLCAAHRTLGATLEVLGAAAEALTHYTQGMALYDAQQHRAGAFRYGANAGVMCYSFAARVLWYLGYPDQGLARSQQALTLAQQSAHPHSLGYALGVAAMVHQHRREVRAVQEGYEAALPL